MSDGRGGKPDKCSKCRRRKCECRMKIVFENQPGNTGQRGDTGTRGNTGPQGDTGQRGDTGPIGDMAGMSLPVSPI